MHPAVHLTLKRFCALIYFVLTVKISIKQFQDRFVSYWPSSAFPQNLDGKRQRRKTSVLFTKLPNLYDG